MELAFDLEKYLKLQSEKILQRVDTFDNKLYIEFGGKLFDDYHACRVLPGFEPDSKLRMLLQIKDRIEIVITISAIDIESRKLRRDLNITYDSEVLRLIDAFRGVGILVGSAVITRYFNNESVNNFIKKLNLQGIKTYKHYQIDSYPQDINKVISENGFGKNEYIATQKPIVIVTAPGPGSGKMATCLSQLYHESVRGIKAGYAKYETFPVWNLPLNHPVNLAYEAATIDLNDINMIDPYHFEIYGIPAVNYNRDVEVFPILKAMFEKIYGESPYKSPTDMGVNMIGFAISNDKVAQKAAKREIIRRYCNSLIDYRNGKINADQIEKMKIIMSKLNLTPENRKVIKIALDMQKEKGVPCAAMELEDGTIVVGKNSALFNCAAGLIFNALKTVSNIDQELDLIPRSVIEPIQDLKIQKLGNHNPRLHVEEALLALAISANTNPLAQKALKNIEKLKGAEVHTTVILPSEDEKTLKKLKINVTSEPEFIAHKLYQK